jgi:exopolysaccharide biosynthesis polyprenyl glycosylphosphotransferase
LSEERQSSVVTAEHVTRAPYFGRPGGSGVAVTARTPLPDGWRTALLVGWDGVTALWALWLARVLSGWEMVPAALHGACWPVWCALPFLSIATQFYFDTYRAEVLRSRSRAGVQSLKASLVAGVLLLLGVALLAPRQMPRDEAVATLALLAIGALGIRLVLRDVIGLPIRRVLIAASGPAADELVSALAGNAGYVFAGRLDEWSAPGTVGREDCAATAYGDGVPLDDGVSAGERSVSIVVTPDGTLSSSARASLRRLGVGGARVFPVGDFYESVTGRIATCHAFPAPGEALQKLRLEPGLIGMKRVADTLLAALLLVVAAPLMIVVAVLVKLTSPGPFLYSQQRMGLNGRSFRLWKFRSMRSDAESSTGPVWAVRHDPRVTPLGRILRRTRLDELPQLFNVLVGDMSLAGPRPERPVFVARFRETIPFYENRLVVRPGLTGWAQVMHRYDESEADVAVKLQYDLFYIKHWSPLLDLQIGIKTIATVLTGSGAQ